MGKLRILVLTITISLCILMMTGCTTYENFKSAFINDSTGKDVTITIGVYEPITGGDSKAAVSEIRGIQLANEVYPNVNDKIVEVVYGDNSSDIYAAESAIKNLLSHNPDIILGSYGSVYSMAASDYINDAKIPAISITNTNPLVTKNSPYYYRVCYADANQGDLLAKYVAKSAKAEHAGILIPTNNDVALARGSAFSDRMEAEVDGSDVIKYYESYEAGTKDYSKQLKELKDSGVKYVFLPGNLTDVVEIVKQADEMKLDVTFLGGNDWTTEDFADNVKDYKNGPKLAFVTYVDPSMDKETDTVSPETQKFLDAYHKKYGDDKEIDENIVLGYDAYLVAIKAASESGDKIKGENIKKVLDGDTTFEGASGSIRFNDVGDPIKTAYISSLSDDGNKLLYTINPVN